MRPPEKWTKPELDAQLPKRAYKKKPPQAKRTQSDIGASTNTSDDGASVEVLKQSPSCVETETLAKAQHPARARAASFDVAGPLVEAPLLDKAAASAALRKAIQSSPPRFPGSQFSPINLEDDISPQSTRRVLFPSPRKPGEIRSLGLDTLSFISASGSGNKENLPPYNHFDEDDPIFYDSPSLTAAPELDLDVKCPRTPPKPSSGGFRLADVLKTPTSSKVRKSPLESASPRRGRRGPTATPTRSSARLRQMAAAELTPFSAELSRLISNNNAFPSRGGTVGSFDGLDIFNFPDFGTDSLGNMCMTGGIDLGLDMHMDLGAMCSTTTDEGWAGMDMDLVNQESNHPSKEPGVELEQSFNLQQVP